jgi:hypothetical protein
MKRIVFLLLQCVLFGRLLSVAGCQTAPPKPPLRPVASVDGPRKTYQPKGFVRNTLTNAEWGMQFVWPMQTDRLRGGIRRADGASTRNGYEMSVLRRVPQQTRP